MRKQTGFTLVEIALVIIGLLLGAAVTRDSLKLGNQVPVGIIAELDRKIDDGNAQTGSFRFRPTLTAAPCRLLRTVTPPVSGWRQGQN
jgi:hypothetical protein